MESEQLEVRTGGEVFTDLTEAAERFVAGRGDGLLNVWVPHATAGLAVFELGAGSEPDVRAALDRIAPRDAAYRHRHGSPGHGADHVLPAVVSPSLTLPVLAGRAALGTWQRIVLVDTNGDNPLRRVRLSFVTG